MRLTAVVRTGATRTVVLIGRYAIKIPSLRGVMSNDARGRLGGIARGLLANQSEYIWHSFHAWDGKVAPVLRSWLLGFIQVYPRCEPLPVDYDGPLPELDPSPGDVKPDNYGRWRGQVVRLDYDMN